MRTAQSWCQRVLDRGSVALPQPPDHARGGRAAGSGYRIVDEQAIDRCAGHGAHLQLHISGVADGEWLWPQ
ncbi:MAG: hypothetical protein ACXVXI_08035, partial [Mycobacteriaceae bacterium]